MLSGTSRGIGFATARALIEEGAHVLGIARNEERLATAAHRLAAHGPGTFDSLCVDLAAQDAPSLVAANAGELWGGDERRLAYARARAVRAYLVEELGWEQGSVVDFEADDSRQWQTDAMATLRWYVPVGGWRLPAANG